MFKPGDKVKLIKDHSEWPDTFMGIRDGILTVGGVYTIRAVDKNYPGKPGIISVQLETDMLGECWWVGASCLIPVNVKSRNLPSWW